MNKLLLILLCLPLLFSCGDKNEKDIKIEMEGFWATYDTNRNRIVSIAYIAEDIFCAKISLRIQDTEIPGVEDCKCRKDPEASWSIENGRLIVSSPNTKEKINYKFIKISDDEFSIKTEEGIFKCYRISKYQAINHLAAFNTFKRRGSR